MRYAVILAGGSGTRLWPMSRAGHPKQLIPFVRGKSLLQLAVDRLEGLVEPERRLICTGESHRAAIRRAMPELADSQVFGEPHGRDTLAAVGLPAAVLAKQDADATIAVFTSDHLIEPIDVFRDCVETGFRLAETLRDALVTFGITPTRPAAEYGYIELGEPVRGFDQARSTARFVEKPDAGTAAEYVASGRFAWNSGMFVWRAATLLDCIERYCPGVHGGLMQIAGAWGTERQQAVLDEVYPTLQKTSVDFAVMEPASADSLARLVTVPMAVNWLDVGGWPAYAETVDADEQGNLAAAERTLLIDCRNNLLVSGDPEHLIAAVGIDNLTIIHTADATLICPREEAERVKQLHGIVAERFAGEYL